MTEPTLLGTSYPVPPDRMPRLQHLRHMLDSGIDLGNDVVRELLDAVYALLDAVNTGEAARDALADELADLRQQLNDAYERGRHEGEVDEREACARIVSAERGIFAAVETRLMVDAIAAAIRARGFNSTTSDSGMLHHCRRGTRQMPRNAEACPECGTKWSDYLK